MPAWRKPDNKQIITSKQIWGMSIFLNYFFELSKVCKEPFDTVHLDVFPK